jgi:excisionase family DNA binding protein
MIDRAEMPAVRIGQRRVRIKQSDLDSYIAA